MIAWLVIITLVVLVIVIALVAAWAYQTAHRLDRLHVRYDLSWQALDGALFYPPERVALARPRVGDRGPGERGLVEQFGSLVVVQWGCSAEPLSRVSPLAKQMAEP